MILMKPYMAKESKDIIVYSLRLSFNGNEIDFTRDFQFYQCLLFFTLVIEMFQ